MPLTLIEISFEKANRPNSYWVVEKEITTGTIRPRHLGTSAFSDNFYRSFAAENNLLALNAAKFSVDLGEDYATFYQLGMRASQQLDGQYRERTTERYYERRDALQAKLVTGLLDKKTQQRNAELEQIVAGEEARQELSAQDAERVKQIIGTLRQFPFKDYSDDRLGIRPFEQRLIYIAERDETKGIKDNYWVVHPSLRADYLATIKFSPLNGLKEGYMEGDEARLREVLTGLGTTNGKLYLQALQFEMKRDALKGWQFFHDSLNDIQRLQSEQRDLYFTVMTRAQLAGLSRFVDAIPFYSARLLEKHNIEVAQIIVNEAFDMFGSGSKEVDVLIFINKHLIQR